MTIHSRYLLALIALSILLVSTNGQASEHWYVGAKAEWVNGSSACDAHATSCDHDTAGGGAYIGYVVNDGLALEGGYNYLGDITANYPALSNPNVSAHYKGEMQGLEFVAKPYWELTEELTMFAKVGTLAWNMDVTGQEVGYEHTANDNGWSPLLGAGLEYAFNRNWSTSLEYQWVNNVGGDATGGTDLNMVNLAVSYHFTPEPAVAPPALVHTPLTTQIPASKVRKEPQWTFNGGSFASNSSQLTVELQQALQTVSKRLSEYPQATLFINTHTDSRGSYEFNQQLSDQRANAVLDYMLKQGVLAMQMRAVGYGDTQPIADNMTAAGRYKNRRVELLAPEFEVPLATAPNSNTKSNGAGTQ